MACLSTGPYALLHPTTGSSHHTELVHKGPGGVVGFFILRGRGLEGGLAFARTRSLRSFGRVVRLCGLAAVVPGLPGALEGLRPLLVHDHVVHALV